MTGLPDISADPLYLTALASLGAGVHAKLAAAPDKGSIAVLPFVDMSGEAGHEHFTDGLTEDIITDLSNVPGFFVIARNSVFAYKGKPTDVRQIAHDLGVKYILEGSARRAAQRLRVNVQLIDASAGGNHIWAERFDRDLADIFAVQDEVTRRIVEAIVGKIEADGIIDRYRPASMEAYDLVVRSRNQWAISRSANAEALADLQQAVELDPNYCEAHWQLALTQFRAWQSWGEPQIPLRAEAVKNALRSTTLGPNNSDAHATVAYVLFMERTWEEAGTHLETALRLNPNNADVLMLSVDYHIFQGRKSEAVEVCAKAIRLNPHPPGWYYWAFGFALVANGQYEQAIKVLRHESTYRTVSRRILAAALALSGQMEEARKEARLFMSASPHWHIQHWIENQPFLSEADARFWTDAYRLAGLPE